MSVTMFVAAMLGPRLAAGSLRSASRRRACSRSPSRRCFCSARSTSSSSETEFAIALALFGVGAGLLLSQLGNVIMSSVDPSKTNEAGGLQGTAQNLGASLGTALIGSVLIAALTTGFVDAGRAEPGGPAGVQEQVAQVAQKGIPVVPVDEVEQARIDAGVPARRGGGDRRRLRRRAAPGLKRAIGAVAIFALLSFWFTRGLPGARVRAP